MRHILLLVVILTIFAISGSCTNDPFSFPLESALANGKPTLAEFGGKNCIPCKSMWPTLKELSQEYTGKLNVVIIDVSQNQDLANKYGIVWIPEQLFFDKTGKVVTRHSGTMTKEEICIQLNDLGIK
jgi:thioredoxin 1